MSIIQFFLSPRPDDGGVPPLPSQPEVAYGPLELTRAFLSDLLVRRGTMTAGSYVPRQILEGTNAKFVPVTAFEPDPATCRSRYYYNAADNILYQRAFVINKPNKGKVVAVWKRIS